MSERIRSDGRWAGPGVGERVVGRIWRLASFGAFVDMGTGAEGLLHVQDMAVADGVVPSDVFTVGQQVVVEVRSVPVGPRDTCGLRLVAPQPMAVRVDRVGPGTAGSGRKQIADPGDDSLLALQRSGVVAAAAGLLIVIGAFLPWIRLGGVLTGVQLPTAGFNGDGIYTLALGVVSVAIAVYAGGLITPRGTEAPRLVGEWSTLAFFGAIGLALSVHRLARIREAIDALPIAARAEVGNGLWLTIAACGVLFVLGIIGAVTASARAKSRGL